MSELPEILAPTHRWQIGQSDYKGSPCSPALMRARAIGSSILNSRPDLDSLFR